MRDPTVLISKLDGPQLAYRPADAARLLGISRSQLYNLFKAGVIRARKIRGSTVVLRADLEHYLASL
jgi:excisionase family DNA binding protein